MKKFVLCVAGAIVAAFAIWVAGCGTPSACQDLFYKLCECEGSSTDKENCKKAVDELKFSADEDQACSEKNTTCACENFKSAETASNACPANVTEIGS